MGHLTDHWQAIQPRHQGILERGRDRHRRQGTSQRVALPLLVQHVRLQQHLGELFDEQRHPIGPGHDVLNHLRRQGFAARQVGNQRFHLGTLQAVERQRRHM